MSGWDAVAPELLARRTRLIPWIVVAGNLVFGVADPLLYRDLLWQLWTVKCAVLAVQVVTLVRLRGVPPPRITVAVGLLSFAAGVAGGTVMGILADDPFTTPLLCVAGALTTAAVVPWGSRAQLVAAAVTVLGAVVTVVATVTLYDAPYLIVATALAAAISVLIADELSRQRAAEARAVVALQRRQAQLAHVLRVGALGQMAAQLAHELTQPLGAIANYAAGCRRRLEAGESPVELAAVLERINEEALRAGQIIQGLRRLVRQDEMRLSAIRMNELVTDVVTLIGGEAREHGIDLQLVLAPGLPPVQADRVQIEQVLINLVRNAIEALREDPGPAPRVEIITRRGQSATVEVLVRDSGPGISEDDLVRVFEPFHTTKASGLGMGLAISHSLIQAHGGTIAITRNPTRGVTAMFTLPRTLVVRQPPPAPNRDEHGPARAVG